MEGGRPVEWSRWIEISTGSYDNHPWWSPDGNTLYFLSRRAGFTCIWAQPLDPATKQPEGPIKEVKHFHGRLRVVESGAAQFGYAMLPDRLYLPLNEAKGNIWLAEPRVEP